MSRKFVSPLTISILILSILACNALSPPTEPDSTPTGIFEPIFTRSPSDLPLTEADVPRVTAQEAKAALDSGEAIIVDVRSANDYETSHIAGAISIPLGQFETNPTGLNLDKDQWIITYCT